jgi:hypothetical protein
MRSWLKVIGLAGALVIPGRAGRGEDPRPDVVGPGARAVRVVALGDSITKGVRAGVRPEETFAALAERALKADGVDAEVVNLGIGGERTDQALKRLDAVSGHRPRVVTVMYGTNDSHVDKGATAGRISLEEYTANLRAIIAGLLLRGIEPILMTEPRWADAAPVDGLGESPNVRLAPYMGARGCGRHGRRGCLAIDLGFGSPSAIRRDPEVVGVRPRREDAGRDRPPGRIKGEVRARLPGPPHGSAEVPLPALMPDDALPVPLRVIPEVRGQGRISGTIGDAQEIVPVPSEVRSLGGVPLRSAVAVGRTSIHPGRPEKRRDRHERHRDHHHSHREPHAGEHHGRHLEGLDWQK